MKTSAFDIAFQLSFQGMLIFYLIVGLVRSFGFKFPPWSLSSVPMKTGRREFT